MLLLYHKLNDQFRQKDEITEHTLSIRLVHCGKHSHETSLVSKKSSLISKKLTAIYGKPKLKVNANTPMGESEVVYIPIETASLNKHFFFWPKRKKLGGAKKIVSEKIKSQRENCSRSINDQ